MWYPGHPKLSKARQLAQWIIFTSCHTHNPLDELLSDTCQDCSRHYYLYICRHAPVFLFNTFSAEVSLWSTLTSDVPEGCLSPILHPAPLAFVHLVPECVSSPNSQTLPPCCPQPSSFLICIPVCNLWLAGTHGFSRHLVVLSCHECPDWASGPKTEKRSFSISPSLLPQSHWISLFQLLLPCALSCCVFSASDVAQTFTNSNLDYRRLLMGLLYLSVSMLKHYAKHRHCSVEQNRSSPCFPEPIM